jgi:hypothetical protein
MTYSKVRCLICGHALSTVDYEDGGPRICGKCWKCPQCGVKVTNGRGGEGIIIDEDDTVICRPCDWAWTFKKFENALVKKANRVICSACKGVGTVPGEKGAKS